MHLTPEQQAFVDAQVATGVFATPEEVVQAGIELLRAEAADRERAAAVRDVRHGVEAYERGEATPAEDAFAEIRRRLGFSP